jgi:hypothetical protein
MKVHQQAHPLSLEIANGPTLPVNGEGFLFIVPCNELLGGQEPAGAISENLSIILSIIAYQAIFLHIYPSGDVARN